MSPPIQKELANTYAEYWLVHPTDRVLTIYRLHEGRYGMPDIRELSDETPIGPLPDAMVRWAPIVSRLLPQPI